MSLYFGFIQKSINMYILDRITICNYLFTHIDHLGIGTVCADKYVQKKTALIINIIHFYFDTESILFNKNTRKMK